MHAVWRELFDRIAPQSAEIRTAKLLPKPSEIPVNSLLVYAYNHGISVEAVKDGSKKNFYIYVELYDWNGNPIRKYKLDQWGYFTVDEANGKLYLLSTNHDDPFFVYDLP